MMIVRCCDRCVLMIFWLEFVVVVFFAFEHHSIDAALAQNVANASRMKWNKFGTDTILRNKVHGSH